MLFEDIPVISDSTGKRFYQTPEGQKYPSVTTVTGWEKQNFFKEWRKKNPKESKRVLSRGNELHELIERYLNNENLDLLTQSPVVSSLFVQMKESLDKIDNIHALEVPLWSDTLKLAGRVDCVAEYEGTLSIIDFKGSNRQKRLNDIENYMLQGTAYSIMWHERTGTPIQEFHIIVSAENGFPCKVFTGNPINYVPRLYEVIQKYNIQNNYIFT
jgi:genome maintenance exonuclease 1